MSRRGIFSDLTSDDRLTAVNSEAARARPVRAFGAFGSVTCEFDSLAAKAEVACEIEARLTAGEVVVELDPGEIDSSFVADRLSQDDEDFQALVRAIEERGQDSPILVRRHPTIDSRYQIAFGHRRLRAALALGRTVRAVVKQLTDRDLVLAQGQENSARANLSFIERALFAHRLEEIGQDRETIMSALAVDKTVVSRMISVASKLPRSLVEAIGPAPGIGRDRWVELAGHYEKNGKDRGVDAITQTPSFAAASSNDRFEFVVAHLTATTAESECESVVSRKKPADERAWTDTEGRRIASIKADKRKFYVAIDEKAAPGFGDYLLRQMDRLYASYQSEKQEGRTDQH